MTISAEVEAVREALSTYLLGQLGTDFPMLEVLSEWPAGPRLAETTISILVSGDPDIRPHVPAVVSSVPTSGSNGLVTYAYGYAEGIPLDLDCWADTKPARDILVLAVRRALNRPPQQTLGSDDGWPKLSRQMYLALAVPGLYGSIFSYRFTAVPSLDDSSSNAEKNEWRSHFRGTADGALWDQDTIALMKRVSLSGRVDPHAPLTQIAVVRPPVQRLTIVVPASAIVGVGAHQALHAFAVFDDDTIDVTATAAWTSTDATIATVAAGVVSGVAPGVCTISASYGGHSGLSAVLVS